MDIELPTDLTAVDDGDLDTLRSHLATAIAELATGASDPDVAAELAELGSILESVNDEATRRERDESLRLAVLGDVRSSLESILVALEADEETDEGDGNDEGAAGEADVADDEPEGDETESEPPSAAELEANDSQSVPATPARTNYTTFAADTPVGGYSPGQPFESIGDIANAMHRVAHTLPNPSGNRPVVRVDLGVDESLAFTDDVNHNAEVLDAVFGAHTTAESLLAAGGWCSPSETRYGPFFEIEGSGASGSVDLPEVGVSRGGLRYPISPTLADVESAPWLWTEENDIDALTDESVRKPNLRIPCIDFAETRLDAHGVSLTHGNLADRAWPELTRRMIRLAMTAHRHAVNNRFLAAMEAGSTAVNLVAEIGDAAVSAALLHAITQQAEVTRDEFYMEPDQLLEVVLPDWIPAAIRTDLSKRSGIAKLGTSNSEIQAWFAERNVRVQFVDDWQRLSPTAEVFPSTAKFLLYPPGTWVRGNGGTLDLGVVRDSTLNASNDHTALWTEQFLSLMKFGHKSRVVTFPVSVDGAAYCCGEGS